MTELHIPVESRRAALRGELRVDARNLVHGYKHLPLRDYHAIAERMEEAAKLLDSEALRLHVMAVNLVDRVAENAKAAKKRQGG